MADIKKIRIGSTDYDINDTTKVAIAQGTDKAGYFLKVNSSGNVEAQESSAVAWGDVTGKPTTFPPSTHASTHKSGGGDEVAGTATTSLTVAGWSSQQQTVSVTDVTTSNTVIVSPAVSSFTDYGTAKIRCTAQGTGTLTFTCDTVPTNAIDVNVVIL